MSATNPFKRHPKTIARLPRIVRLYILHSMVGFALSAVFTGAILWLNVAGIGHLVWAVPGGLLAALVFFVLNGIVFAGVQTGIVVMTMSYDSNDTGGGRRILAAQPAHAALRRPVLIR